MDLWIPETAKQYEELDRWIASIKDRSLSDWAEVMREYAKHDLFFLVTRVLSEGQIIHSELKTPFYWHDHYVRACRQYEWQMANGGGCDVSGRGSGKSTIRTKAMSIQLLLNYPDISIVIFSAKKLLAKKHIRVIKDELESNKILKVLFDDVLYSDPQYAVKEGQTTWSLDDGLRVKRTMIRSTNTIEIHSWQEGGPVGTRFDVLMLDDVETAQIVGNPEMQEKLDDAYAQTISLLTPVAVNRAMLFLTNTRFSESGLVQRTFDRYAKEDPKRVRAVPGELLNGIDVYGDTYPTGSVGDGPLGGQPLYPLTKELLEQRYNETPIKSDYGLQMCLSYTAAESARLPVESISYYSEESSTIGADKNVYVCIDASRGVVDPTAIWVWGLGTDHRYYWLDAVVRKMDPAKPEFHNEIFNIVSKWSNLGMRVVEVRVEQMGGSMWADLIRNELKSRGCYVPVIACKSITGRMKEFDTGKNGRIFQRWAPMMSRGDVIFPLPQSKGGRGIVSINDKGESVDLVRYFFDNEATNFPRGKHDDMLDAGALIHDAAANEEHPIQWPYIQKKVDFRRNFSNKLTSWMSAG